MNLCVYATSFSVFTKLSSLEMKLYGSYPHPGNPSPMTIVSVMDSGSTFFVTGLASSSLESPSDLHFWNSSISTAGICGDDNCAVEVSIRDEGSTSEVFLCTIIPAELQVVECWLEDGLCVRVLTVILVLLLACLNTFGNKVPAQDLSVEEAVHRCLKLVGFVLSTRLTGVLLLQRSTCFQNWRASKDLGTYSKNRYTPRKAVARVKTHAAGWRTASGRSLLASSPTAQLIPNRRDSPKAMIKFSFSLRRLPLPPNSFLTFGLHSRLAKMRMKMIQFTI